MWTVRVPDEPVFRKLWRRWRMSHSNDSQELESEVLSMIPADVVRALQRSDRNEPLVKHLVQSAITRFVTDIDRRTLDVLTAKIMAGTAAVKAATEARRAVHELSRVDQELDQRADLNDLRHETARLAEQDKQELLRLRGTHRQCAAARLTAQRVWLERRLDEADSPKAASTWDQLLSALTDGITGGEDFRARSEEFLDDYAARRRVKVRDGDPRREEKLAAIEALVEDLRERRDWMMRDRWNLKE
jgi:hypothetical protein